MGVLATRGSLTWRAIRTCQKGESPLSLTVRGALTQTFSQASIDQVEAVAALALFYVRPDFCNHNTKTKFEVKPSICELKDNPFTPFDLKEEENEATNELKEKFEEKKKCDDGDLNLIMRPKGSRNDFDD